MPPIVTPTGPTIVKVPVIPQFNLDLEPCPKVGGGNLDTDLDVGIKGKRAQVRADCNENKLKAAAEAMDSAIRSVQPEQEP